jgi:hypothetical protein
MHFLGRDRVGRPVLLGMLAIAGACSSETPVETVCAGGGVQGIELTARDTVNRGSLDGSATATIVWLYPRFETGGGNSAAPDSATGRLGTPTDPLLITLERAGRFRIRLEAPGYSTWERIVEVRFEVGACTAVKSQTIIAELRRAN